ncbi:MULTISPECIES: two-component regulator propeller domain-containing protein [unclassified Leeuwenhoekiella]|uniref:hybrid sensor histidine kinase/response regulator transcription factor n=1 Tax=unclassified Leeuwenhoekiella TaxID=2615029 RepID=UPI000C47AD4A|nr:MULTISPECIES: two-component regulator propeller domain-containing protein [unclassified Leeuwenhoekiella]MAW93729.1 hybrid sensor histidine kinase/response regulator [Leeuwenhoekiella sp.]MBA83048.1 hybrid sensor histidine kinase/response regulator [Leeuwenhoekiella sp.]
MNLRLKFFILLHLLFVLSVSAQNGRIFSSDSELSSSLINAIYQDHKGYIWIATEDGLNKYDGAKFVTYKKNAQDSTSLLNNYVKSIFEDDKNNLYFGFFNGLQIYDHATDSFKQIPLSINEEYTYDAHVTNITQRKTGEILIGTSGRGVFRLQKNGDDFLAENLPEFLPTAFVDHIYQDSKHNLWFITPETGLFLVNQKNEITPFFQEGNTRASLSAIGEDEAGNIYAASYTQGLFKFNSNDSVFESIPNTKHLVIHSLFLNSENEMLVGTDGDGLFRFDPSTQTLSPYPIMVSSFDSSKSKVHDIVEDDSGNTWLGLYQKGVVLLPKKINNFNYIGYESSELDIIGSNCVMSVFKDSKDILWVGTDGDGLYAISPENKVIRHYKDQNYLGSKLNTVVSIFEDSRNTIWVGTYLNGLAKLEEDASQIQFISNLVDELGNPVKSIYTIVEDDRSNLWLGSMGSGLFKLNLETNAITACNVEIADGPEGPKFFNNKWINNLLLDRSRRLLYVASYDGISKFDLEDQKFISYTNGIRKFDGEIIYTIHSDTEDNLWLGTANGLKKTDRVFKLLAHYTIEDGLPNNTICAIEQDSNQMLWVSTNHGISEFNPDKESFLNYYFNDGLQGNEFSKNASYLHQENQLIFGGMNGVTYFNPQTILDTEKQPEIYIIDVYLQNTPVRKGMKSGSYEILNKAIIEADTINLSYQDNSFSLEFSSMEYRNPNRISYAYSINDGPWINLSSGVNTVAFDNLEAGTYDFKLRAKDYDQFSEVRNFTAIIHPLWYLSATAKLIYFLLFLIVTAIVIYELKQRQKSRNRLREYQKSKQINEAKLQFLTNISHDIRTPLTMVINPLKKLLKNDADPVRRKSYETMMRNTDRIYHLANQLLDVRKIDSGQLELHFERIELVKYITDICAIFEDQIEAKEIQFEFKHQMDKLIAWVDPNYFDKIIQNLVANSLKFVSKGGSIKVVLDTISDLQNPDNPGFFEVSVIDNGIGIKKGMEKFVFDRFYQIKGTPHHLEGTGIGLNLTRSIAELHHGTIYAENNENDKGCKFVTRIPLGNAHLRPHQLYQSELKQETEKEAPALTNYESEALEKEVSHTGNKILVVDDDLEIRKYIKKELSDQFRIALAVNGKEALAYILQEAPDLVISDIMMPEMDGLELCKRIKKNININHIPVILLTAKSTQERNLESLNLGADAYIPKPFDVAILQKTALNLIQNRKLLKNNYDGSQLQEDKVKQVKLESSDEILLKKVMGYINDNLDNPNLNVEMIANAVGISRVHLYRKLKELTNQSASDLMKNIRLKQAADLLSSKSISVAEVAYAVGFSNLSTFSTSFKNLYGIPPKKYQETHLKEQD